MGDPAMTLGHEDESYYARFLPVFLLIALLAGILCFGTIILTEGVNLNRIGIAAVLGVLVFAGVKWARYLIAAYPVCIGPGGLRVYGLRGGPLIDAYRFKWSDITQVSRFYFPFIPCLVLRVRGSKRRYWIPQGLVNGARFKNLVNNYAGRAHPLSRALYGN